MGWVWGRGSFLAVSTASAFCFVVRRHRQNRGPGAGGGDADGALIPSARSGSCGGGQCYRRYAEWDPGIFKGQPHRCGRGWVGGGGEGVASFTSSNLFFQLGSRRPPQASLRLDVCVRVCEFLYFVSALDRVFLCKGVHETGYVLCASCGFVCVWERKKSRPPARLVSPAALFVAPAPPHWGSLEKAREGTFDVFCGAIPTNDGPTAAQTEGRHPLEGCYLVLQFHARDVFLQKFKRYFFLRGIARVPLVFLGSRV